MFLAAVQREYKEEAYLPLRNKAPTMHFFVAQLLSIAVMTYTNV